MAALPNPESVLFHVQPVADDVRLRVTPDARLKDNYVRGFLSRGDVLAVVDVTRGYDADGRRREWCRVVDAETDLTGWIARSVVDKVDLAPVPAPAAPPVKTWWEPERIIVYLALLAALIGVAVAVVQTRTARDERRTAELKQSKTIDEVTLPREITVKMDSPPAPDRRADRANVIHFEKPHDTRDVRARLGIAQRPTARRTPMSG